MNFSRLSQLEKLMGSQSGSSQRWFDTVSGALLLSGYEQNIEALDGRLKQLV